MKLRAAGFAAALVVAACGAWDPPPTPNNAATGDPILYACGGAPFTIEALVAPGHAEAGGSDPAVALAAFLSGADPRWGAETAFLPKMGWRPVGVTPTEVVFVADKADGVGWANVTTRLDAGIWQVATFGDCIPYAVVPRGLIAARWWVDPARRPLPGDRSIAALVREQTCAGGRPPDGRIADPLIRYDASSITILMATTTPGAADCQAAPDATYRIELTEPMGTRALLDGYQLPARDAFSEPEVGFGVGG